MNGRKGPWVVPVNRNRKAVVPERRNGAPEALTAHDFRNGGGSKKRTARISASCPTWARHVRLALPGPKFWKRKLRAEHKAGQGEVRNLPRFSLFSLVNFR